MNATAEYIAAYEAHNTALEIFNAAVAKFRAVSGIASEADYAEFAAAQAAKNVADEAFDEAYNAECDREIDAVIEENNQMAFAL